MKLQLPWSPVSDMERVVFTKHLATMIKAGIPLGEALDVSEEHTNNSTFAEMIKKIADRIENGQTLRAALQKYPRVFDALYLSLIEIGETSGTLEQSLTFLAEQLHKNLQLKRKIQAALLYPGLVLAATSAMGAFISFVILPQLIDLFTAFDNQLPLATQLLLWLAIATRDYGVIFLVSLAGALVGFSFLLQLPTVKYAWHWLLLRLPLLGPFFVKMHIAQITRNLGTLLNSGVPLTKSLEVIESSLDNTYLQRQLQNSSRHVESGKALGQALTSITLFPALVTRMISVGEKTGKLDETLLYLGEFYEEEIEQASKNLTTILEPLLLVGVGLAVGFVALAIIGPIYNLTGSIRQ